MADVVVIGGGVGGLCAAIRLRTAGHDVVVFERNAEVGGKLAVRHLDGFTFDTGPSLLTLPHVFDDVFRVAGTSLADEVELVRLDPQCRYRWPDGSSLDVRDDPALTEAAFERFAAAGAAWRRFDSHGRTIWEVSERTFFAGPMSSPRQLVRRMRSPGDLVAIDALRTLHRRSTTYFRDERLQQWVGRYATYSGSSPYRAPATLSCIPHIESRFGAWYPMGGLGAMREALARVARALGVEVRVGVDIEGIVADDTAVTGVRSAAGETTRASIIVANVDAQHLYRDLLDDERAVRRLARAEPSTSGFAILAGVAGRTDGVAHHNVWFSGDYRTEFAQIAAGLVPDTPTIYAAVSSVTDPSQAPVGHENWFVLINTPPTGGVPVEREQLRDRVLAILASRGVELRHRIVVSDSITPTDIASRYRAHRGSIYGTSSNGRRAAFLRPGNRGTRRGLYLVGGSSHPGGGLPLVAMSARIVADMIRSDLA